MIDTPQSIKVQVVTMADNETQKVLFLLQEDLDEDTSHRVFEQDGVFCVVVDMSKYIEWKEEGKWSPESYGFEPTIKNLSDNLNEHIGHHAVEAPIDQLNIFLEHLSANFSETPSLNNNSSFEITQISGLNRKDILLNFETAKETNFTVGRSKLPVPAEIFNQSHSACVIDGRTQYNFYDEAQQSEDGNDVLIVPALHIYADSELNKIPQGQSFPISDPKDDTITGALTPNFIKANTSNIVNVLGNIDSAHYIEVGKNADNNSGIHILKDYPFAAKHKETTFIFWGDDHEQLRAHYHVPQPLSSTDTDLTNLEMKDKNIMLTVDGSVDAREPTEKEKITHDQIVDYIVEKPKTSNLPTDDLTLS